ncbi:MAG: hypothetical protein V9H26_04000 [Verrucomicrobiota bacterium]
MDVIAWLLGGHVPLLRWRPSSQGTGSSILRVIRALSDAHLGKSLGEARKDAASNRRDAVRAAVPALYLLILRGATPTAHRRRLTAPEYKKMSRPTQQLRLLHLGAMGVALVIAALVLAAVIYIREQSRREHTDAVQDLAHAVSLSLDAWVGTIDYVLQVSADEIGHQSGTHGADAAAINRFLARQQERFPYIDLLRATSPEGEAIWGRGVDPAQRASLAQREYFQRLRDDPTLGMVIAEPIVGKISQQWIWLMARRIQAPDGSFAGLVYASMFIRDLTRMLQQSNPPPGGAIVLRDAPDAHRRQHRRRARAARFAGTGRGRGPTSGGTGGGPACAAGGRQLRRPGARRRRRADGLRLPPQPDPRLHAAGGPAGGRSRRAMAASGAGPAQSAGGLGGRHLVLRQGHQARLGTGRAGRHAGPGANASTAC